RTALALDRTLLSWVRTSLSLIGFGFTLARFLHDLVSKGYLHGVEPEGPRQLGILMMILGVAGLLAGSFDYYRCVRRLKNTISISTWSSSLVVTLLLAFLSILLMFSLLNNLNP